MDVTIKFRVNGKERSVTTEPLRPLLEVLREDLQLTGAKYGCGEGQCGACLVLVDEQPAKSCLLPMRALAGRSVTTIEGLAESDSLHPVQEAFLEEGAMQCGYCTAGMIMSAFSLLRKKPDPTDEEIIKGMNGNLCRCNEYVKIIRAVRSASQKLKEQSHG